MKFTKVKKIFATAMAAVMCASFSMAAFAEDWDSEAVEGYGTLYGWSRAETFLSVLDVYTETTISQNPDSAYLKVKAEVMNSAGATLDYDEAQSADGATSFSYEFRMDDATASAVFVAHNVQGGGQYPAQVVYTRTGVDQGDM